MSSTSLLSSLVTVDHGPSFTTFRLLVRISSIDGVYAILTIVFAEYLNYEGGKFSKSHQRGVFGPAAKETGIPPSVWRYYLISTRPETADAMFSWADCVSTPYRGRLLVLTPLSDCCK